MGGIVAIIMELLDLVEPAIKAGVAIFELIGQAKAALASSNDPTDDQWIAVDTGIKALRAQLQIDPPDAV